MYYESTGYYLFMWFSVSSDEEYSTYFYNGKLSASLSK